MSILHIIILAAGSSSRMGATIKQLLKLGDQTILQYTIEKAKQLQPNSINVVLGAYAEEIQLSVLDAQVNFIYNPNWKEGMGSSLSRAMRSIVTDNKMQVDGILVLIADQPLVMQDDDYLTGMIAQWRDNPQVIHASQYAHKLGVPCIFPSRLTPVLSELQGDTGARSILNDEEENVVSFPLGSLSKDIDTIEDYEEVMSIWKHRNNTLT